MLRNNLTCLWALFISLGVLTASCSKDDEEKPIVCPITFSQSTIFEGESSIEPLFENIYSKLYLELGVEGNSCDMSLVIPQSVDHQISKITIAGARYSFTDKDVRFSGTSEETIEYNGQSYQATIQMKGAVTPNTAEVTFEIQGVEGITSPLVFKGKFMDRKESSEAQLLSISFENEMIVRTVIQENEVIVYAEKNIADKELEALKASFEVSEYATVTSGYELNLTQEVVITVVSEDGAVTKEYTVSLIKTDALTARVFDFSKDWATLKGGAGMQNMNYSVPSPSRFWKSSDSALTALMQKRKLKEVSVKQVESVGKKVAYIKTLDTKGEASMGLAATPKVSTGVLYLGEYFHFNRDYPQGMRQGVPFLGKPTAIKARVSYTPGEVYYEATNGNLPTKSHLAKVNADAIDEFQIFAALYEVSDENEIRETLDGKSIFDSDRLVAKGAYVGKKTEGFEDLEFAIEYNDKHSYDSKKKYRFAIILMSSKNGNIYSGAPGSILLVESLEIVE